MAYSALHLIAFGGIMFGWLMCIIVVFPFWFTKEEETKEMFHVPKEVEDLDFIHGSTISILNEGKIEISFWVGVWTSHMLVTTWPDQKMEINLYTVYYEPGTSPLYFSGLMGQFYSIFNLTVGLWSIIAGFIDSVYFRGRSTTSVGLGALMAALAGPPTCAFMSALHADGFAYSTGSFMYIFGCVVMGVSGAGLVLLPPPKPLEYEDTTLSIPGRIE